jgi:hypothetical protein
MDACRKTFVVFVDQKRDIGKTANDGNRFIARGVVHDDDFGGLPRRLPQPQAGAPKALQAIGDERGSVVGDDDG